MFPPLHYSNTPAFGCCWIRRRAPFCLENKGGIFLQTIPITAESIQAWSGGGSAWSNGKALAAKGQLYDLRGDALQTLIWGLCRGSGAKPYSVSIDFSEDPAKPIFRCSCPSKQIPCKHAVGLLFAWLLAQDSFSVAEIPEDIAAKREKREQTAQKKAEKAAQEASNPERKAAKKTNTAAQMKKIASQLEGLEMLKKILHQLVEMGLNTVSAASLEQLEDQSRQLGAHYLIGAQNGLWELIDLLQHEAPKTTDGLSQVSERLLWLQNLAVQGKVYLQRRLENPDSPPDISSPIEEWLGRIWQLQELRDLGQVRENIEILQLSFGVFYDRSKREYADIGLWVVPGEAQVWETRNYRPLKASNYVREEDSENRLLQLPLAYLYPGGLSRRLRWETYTPREAVAADFARVLAGAMQLKPALYLLREQIKNPLAEKHPVLLLRAERLIHTATGSALLDATGHPLALSDLPPHLSPPSVELLRFLPQDNLENCAVLAKFAAFTAESKLSAQALALIGEKGIVRLT